MVTRRYFFLILSLVLTILAGCGDNGNNNGSPVGPEPVEPVKQYDCTWWMHFINHGKGYHSPTLFPTEELTKKLLGTDDLSGYIGDTGYSQKRKPEKLEQVVDNYNALSLDEKKIATWDGSSDGVEALKPYVNDSDGDGLSTDTNEPDGCYIDQVLFTVAEKQ